MKNTHYLALDDTERVPAIRSRNNLRNHLINQNRHTDGIDDVIIKIVGVKNRISKYFIWRIRFMKNNLNV